MICEMFKYQIINHGKENHQYFQGCGVCFSEFDSVVTGCGSDAVEAYEDALDCLAQDAGVDIGKMPKRPRGYGITRALRVLKRDSEDTYVYVSIRYNRGVSL